jgi:RimJ/RimL family protein N-acetyltransferase
MTASTQTEAQESAEAEPQPATRPDEGLAYLIGETIFLRGLEIGDAKWTTAWRGSPFPVSAQQAEEQIKKQAPEQGEQRIARLIACRRDNGQPVGAVLVNDHDPTDSFVTLCADPALGTEGAAIQAEALGLVVPWLSGERARPMVTMETDVDLEPVVRQAVALGMRPAVCLRDGVWRDGRLHDLVNYQLPNPIWVSRLGDPGAGIDDAGEPVAAPSSPAPRRDPAVSLPLPQNAFLGSERLALRPMQVEDAKSIVRWVRQEPDASFGHSRFPVSPVAFSDWFGKIGENEPSKDFELAVVLRESGELIGEVGLYSIDWLARTAESGSWLYRPEYRGSGYGTEAKHLLLEYAFDRLGLHMIWSWVKVRNPRSQAALRKQGYRDAGRLNWTGFGPDGFESARMFDLLATEWRAARDRG